MDVVWNFKYKISPAQAILLTGCTITQAAHFTVQLQYIIINLPIQKVSSSSGAECSFREVPTLSNSNYPHKMWCIATLLSYTWPINENCWNLNDYIDVFVQDYENETVYVGDDVEVEIFALEVVESDGGICNSDEDR